MAAVTFERVTKRFGDVVAVDELALEVLDGELLVLLGPSGCGKSTALRMVAGLEEPDHGDICIGGRSMAGIEGRDRDVAMVFQSYALYPHLTVRRNIEFPLRARGVEGAERDRLVAEAAGQLGLEGLLDRKPRALSGGQRQRVALARAIVRRPAVFLMDEPLSNLDAQMRATTRTELVGLHRRVGTTFVYVTHDQVEAMTMGDRVAVLDGGRLQQVGPPQEVYDRPANTFVARFVGSPGMNLLRGGSGVGGAVDDAVVLGVRPEHLDVGPAGGAGAAAVVRAVESLGHERHVVARTDAGDEVVARLEAGEVYPSVGDRVSVNAQPRHVHRFDVATGRRVPA
jgi:multiple sugar transport system ATP-binding protein